jgi:hypothetical protein
MYEAGGRVGSAVQARVCARRASSNARARVKPSKPVHELAGVCKVARANGPQSAAASRYHRPLALFVPRRLHLHHAGDISITCLPTTLAPRQPALNQASAAAASSCPRSAAFIVLDRSDAASQANSTPCCVCRR